MSTIDPASHIRAQLARVSPTFRIWGVLAVGTNLIGVLRFPQLSEAWLLAVLAVGSVACGGWLLRSGDLYRILRLLSVPGLAACGLLFSRLTSVPGILPEGEWLRAVLAVNLTTWVVVWVARDRPGHGEQG